MCLGSGRFRIREYMHHQKIYNHKKQGWSAEGPYELYIPQCSFIEMVRGSMSSKSKQFHKNPTKTVENILLWTLLLTWVVMRVLE